MANTNVKEKMPQDPISDAPNGYDAGEFADKISLNYASLMGIRTDAHLDPNSQQYSWVSSIFYAGYIFWEFPTTYLVRRLPIAKYTSINIITWGAVLTCHAAVSSYKGRRIGYWLNCNGITLILMAVIGYGLSAVQGTAIASWKILSLMLGVITCITGVLCYIFLPDDAANARFLNEREKAVATERIRGNFQGIGSQTWKWYQFREALVDFRTWLYVLYSLLMNIPNGGITTFGSLVVNSFVNDSRLVLLLGAPSGLFDLGGKLFFTWMSDKLLDRSLPSFIAIMFPMAGLLIGYYMISVSGASWGLVMIMISNSTVGYTKKATVNGLQILAYEAGNWIGPQTFRFNEAPNYKNGKLMVAIM
ncbi:MFS allantoate transporter [Seiridium cupressi]